MIYSVTYEIDGICGPGGYVDTSREQVVDCAKSMAETGFDQLADWRELDWFDLEGEPADPRALLRSSNRDELVDAIDQISDVLKARRLGYVDLQEYDDLFELVSDQNVEDWASAKLKRRIGRLRKSYVALVADLAHEWHNA